MRHLPLTLFPLLLVACERQPVAPDRLVAPQFAATRDIVTGSVYLVDDPADCTANPNIGEIVLFTGRINVAFVATTTPSGNVDTILKTIYDPAAHLVGQTSGAVWKINPINTHPIGITLVHGSGAVNKITIHEFYTNAAGAHLMLKVNALVTVDANGSIRVSRDWVWACIGG
jgi:hypothetical protein